GGRLEHRSACGLQQPGATRCTPRAAWGRGDRCRQGNRVRCERFRLTAVRVSAVSEKPLERFGLDIFARTEDNRKPTPAEAVYVCTCTDQEFHLCSLARL